MGDRVVHGFSTIPAGVAVGIIGVPQDIGVVRNGGRPGSAAGPDAIRAMLYRMTPYDLVNDREVGAGRVADLGDVPVTGELEEIHDRVTDAVADLRAVGIFPIVLGGGHDIAYATARGGLGAGSGGGLVNVDAHLDVRPPDPSRNSGTSVRMLIDERTVHAESVVEYGIQSHANALEQARWLADLGGTIIALDETRRRGFNDTFAVALEIASSHGRSVHGSLDVDGVIGSSAPGVSAVMADGLASWEFVSAARLLARHPAVVSIDIAELNPVYDRDNLTARLAALAVMEIIAARASMAY